VTGLVVRITLIYKSNSITTASLSMHTQPTPSLVRFLQPVMITAALATFLLALALPVRTGATPPPGFTTTPLVLSGGSAEPEISIGKDGTMAMVSISFVGTYVWTGPFGSPPVFQGIVDGALQHPGRLVFGGNDADVDIGSTGRLHITSGIALEPPTLNHGQSGVSAITCPSPALGSFSANQCTAQLIDTTTTDRPWITSDASHVYISYHDSGNSSLIHVQRSDDDGFTWKRVGDPIVGQGGLTVSAHFLSVDGNLVADPHTHNVYAVYVARETAETLTPNHVIVSRSNDMGETWTANVVFADPPGIRLGNLFPALAVDPVTGNLYAVWSDGHTIGFASSTDQGNTWTPAMTVNSPPATTALFPWVAAYNGVVDVVYYGTTAASHLDPSADWHVYFAQFNGLIFTQTQVNAAANHHGVVCTNGGACGPGTRNLLDLFQLAIDPQNAKAAIIYTDDTLTTTNDPNIDNFTCSPNQSPPCPLPQAVLAQQN
jgi:hypothetical protein